MKRLAITLALAGTLGLTALPVAADPPPWSHAGGRGHNDGYGDDYIDYARVMAVQPIRERSYRPERVCRDVQVDDGRYEVSRGGNTAGTVLGAIVGGVLGNTVGKGDGRKAATVAGAVVGGAIGNRAGRRETVYGEPTYARRCDTRSVYAGDRVVGYDVTYRYHGRTYRTRLDHDPGRRMRVAVDSRVRPAE